MCFTHDVSCPNIEIIDWSREMNKRLMRLGIFWLHPTVFVIVIGIGVVEFLSGEDLNGEYWAIVVLMLATLPSSIDLLLKSRKQ